MTLTVRAATPADLAVLCDLGERTFVQTFVDEFALPYTKSDLAEYLPGAYGPAAISGYLADPAYQHFIAENDGKAVGFTLVGPNGLPHDDARPEDGELKRIYLLKDAQGLGAGKALYDASIAWLEKDGPRTIWLGVWSLNEKAQRFYEKNGFVKAGEYRFKVGETLDHEFIFRRG